MSEKKIVIKIDDTGNLNAETFGMVGTDCIDELDKIMKDIALLSSRKKKKEFFEQETTIVNRVINKRD